MVTISLCMIVKNEEALLGRCLSSVGDVADEIIIVDTGSSDHTKAAAAAFGSRIYDYTWQDDFSAARNFAFSKAKMDYCMWLDADDVMEQTQKELLKNWKKQADGSADAVMLKYVTGFDEQGRGTFSYYRERLLKRSSGFQWKGRVHEVISVSGRVEYLDIAVEHRSQKKVYGLRNLRIYQRMKSEGVKLEPRDAFYYARELYYHKQYQEAVKEFRAFLDMEGGFAENQAEACRIAAYCCYGLGKDQEALEFLLEGLRYRTPGGELCCDLGKHFMDRGMWEQAVFWFQAALHAPQKETSGGFIQKECYGYIPCVQLCVCYDRMGEGENALNYHRMAGSYKPYGKEYRKNEEYFSRFSQPDKKGTSEKNPHKLVSEKGFFQES